MRWLPGILLLAAGPLPAQTYCERLIALHLNNGSVTAARSVGAGDFPSPDNSVPADFFERLPAFCRVSAILRPSSDSDIRIEVWLPKANWNRKLQAVGNGGWGGEIAYPMLAQALERGYASASTDTGHRGGSASFALGHPDRVIDFGYRAVHEMALAAKAIIAAFYGQGPRRSYWNGCSTGGKQGLTEAQRYPEDFDAILAGAPANYWTHLTAATLWIAQAANRSPKSALPQDALGLLHDSVLRACDALDGARDGVLQNPELCHFDPAALECKPGAAGACLSAEQVETARRIYGPVRNPKTGEELFPGLARGSELGWGVLAGPEPLGNSNDYFRYVVFKSPNWSWRTLRLDRDVALADEVDMDTINATDPDLREFAARGGKLLLYHGWSDERIPPLSTLNYYRSVEQATGAGDSFARLFLVPGMAHCGGGEGPTRVDWMSVLEAWAEQKAAPQQAIAAGAEQGRTRLVCAYPKVARYKGSGDVGDAGNFSCAAQ
jgi:feruloyl esterase